MRVLAIGAHPDDIELGCGASLAAHHAAGDEIALLVMTTGEQGPQAARSRVEIIRLTGSPTYVACRRSVPGNDVATWSENRAPSLLATPGIVLPSWTTSGTCRLRAAR